MVVDTLHFFPSKIVMFDFDAIADQELTNALLILSPTHPFSTIGPAQLQ
jgi:hypothetical protein